VGRVRLAGTDPVVDAAVDDLLAAAALEAVDLVLPGWAAAVSAGVTVLFAEALASDGARIDTTDERLGRDVRERFARARTFPAMALAAARRQGRAWRAELD